MDALCEHNLLEGALEPSTGFVGTDLRPGRGSAYVRPQTEQLRWRRDRFRAATSATPAPRTFFMLIFRRLFRTPSEPIA